MTALVAAAVTSRVRAQDEQTAELAKALEGDRQAANQAYEQIRTALPLSEEAVKEISGLSFDRRVTRAGALDAVWQPYGDPYLIANKAPELLDPDTGYLFAYMQEAEIAPIPEQSDIPQDPYWEPAPTSEEWVLLSEETVLKGEQKWEVVVDICLDTFGLLSIKVLAREVLMDMEGYDEQKASMEEALAKGDAAQIRDAIFGFIEWWRKEKVFKAYLAKLVERKVAGVLLRSLCLRLVPFVGWGWLLVAFGLAINRHWDRLIAP